MPPRYRSGLEDVAFDPVVEGGLWLATHRGILRSDDLLQSLYPIGQNHFPNSTIVTWKDEPGHLFSIGSDGVWESMDGGMRWSPIYDGLTMSQVFDIDTWKGVPIIGTEEGVFFSQIGEQQTDIDLFQKVTLPKLPILLEAAQDELDGQLSSIEIQRRFINSRRAAIVNNRRYGETEVLVQIMVPFKPLPMTIHNGVSHLLRVLEHVLLHRHPQPSLVM